MDCIPPNPRRVGYIDPIHGPLDGHLYMGSHIHQQLGGLSSTPQVLGSTPGGSEFQTAVKKIPSPATTPKHKRKVPARTHTGNGAPV